MKSLTARMLGVGIVMAAAVGLHAQTKTVTANVPFNFYAGGAVMAKGHYSVSETREGNVVVLKSADQIKILTAFTATGKSSEERPRMVFRRYGDTYFLSEVWAANGSLGYALPHTAREKELTAKSTAPPMTEIVALEP